MMQPPSPEQLARMLAGPAVRQHRGPRYDKLQKTTEPTARGAIVRVSFALGPNTITEKLSVSGDPGESWLVVDVSVGHVAMMLGGPMPSEALGTAPPLAWPVSTQTQLVTVSLMCSTPRARFWRRWWFALTNAFRRTKKPTPAGFSILVACTVGLVFAQWDDRPGVEL